MKLYHVSYNRVDSFSPRIPKEIIPGEDTHIPRICFATNIVKCINAKPRKAEGIKTAIENNLPFGIYVYEIDSENYIQEKELLTPEFLYSSKLLADAKLNDEYWLLISPKEIKETRYELESAKLEKCHYSYESALLKSIKLEQGKSKESLLLEEMTKESRCIYKDLTTDLLLCTLADKLHPKLKTKNYT